jgi:hypothetical protein
LNEVLIAGLARGMRRIELDSFIFPLGLILFAAVTGIRIWARSNVSANRDAIPTRALQPGADDDANGERNVAQIF